MHAEIGADAMPRAVIVIQPRLPERPPGQGIKLAYKVARDNFKKGGINRVVLATPPEPLPAAEPAG